MSTKDELEARAREHLEHKGYIGANEGEKARLMASFAQQEAPRAGEAKVREFVPKVAGQILKLDAEPITTMEQVFREMFPDSDL